MRKQEAEDTVSLVGVGTLVPSNINKATLSIYSSNGTKVPAPREGQKGAGVLTPPTGVETLSKCIPLGAVSSNSGNGTKVPAPREGQKGAGVSTPLTEVETFVLFGDDDGTKVSTPNNFFNGTATKGIHFDKVPAPEVLIVRKNVKHINIKVKPNGEVILTVPTRSDEKDIAYVLKKRAAWIEKKIAFFDGHRDVSVKEYVSGENFRYLGRNYRLKVIESREEGVKLQRGYLQVFVKHRDHLGRKKRLLRQWYMQKARHHFHKAIEKYQPLVQKEVDRICIREMKSRWGSCNPSKGYINLNLTLIEKPTECIEYVVFHELAHLVHADHSRRFYAYLDLYMPDWRKRKERLERMG